MKSQTEGDFGTESHGSCKDSRLPQAIGFLIALVGCKDEVTFSKQKRYYAN